jgi:hypothetical protein
VFDYQRGVQAKGKKHYRWLARLSYMEMALLTGQAMQHTIQGCVHNTTRFNHKQFSSSKNKNIGYRFLDSQTHVPRLHARAPQAIPSERTSARIDMGLDEVKAD